jgi:hypothetical protein
VVDLEFFTTGERQWSTVFYMEGSNDPGSTVLDQVIIGMDVFGYHAQFDTVGHGTPLSFMRLWHTLGVPTEEPLRLEYEHWLAARGFATTISLAPDLFDQFSSWRVAQG